MTKKYYQHPEYKTVYGESVPTPVGRFAWPSLVTPKAPPIGKEGIKGNPRFEISLILAKDNPKVKTFLKLMESEATEMLKVFNQASKAKISIDTYCQDGDAFDAEKYPYYAGNWVVVARNVKLPTLVDDAKGEVAPSFIKGGMTGKLMVTPLITAHGLSYKLEVVQFLKDDGTRFAGSGRDTQALVDALDDDKDEPTVDEALDKAVGNTPSVNKEAKAAASQKGKQAALARL